MDLVGNTLGRYHIRAKIGSQTGIVELYKAYDPILEREVEIKVLFPSRVKDKEVVQRFRLDAYTVSQLTHPNIISVPAQWNKEPLYIVTEATDDESLRELIKQEAPLHLLRAMSLLEQIAAGLDYAHTRSVIHQDLRPDQILIKAQSQVQIKNFKLFPDEERFQNLSKAEKEIIAYVAPEVIQNQALTPQTDIYALGIIAYELLAGHPPFQGKKSEVLDAHLTQSPPSLHQSNSRIPAAVDQVIAKALAKTASERYLTASAFVHALGQALQDSTSSRLVKPSSSKIKRSASSLRQAPPPRSKLSRFSWDKIAMIFVILCSCEIIRLSIMQIIISPVSLAEVTTPFPIPTVISLGSSTPTEAATSTVEINLVNNNEPDNQEEAEATKTSSIAEEATPSTTATVEASSTATIEASATATEEPSATATEAPSATATEAPPPTATEAPPPTATEAPPPTVTEAPLPTATEVVGPPRANISNIQINYSVLRNGQSGIQYLIDFTFENGQGVSSQLGVHFYDSLGDGLTDQNDSYTNGDGQVFVGEYFIPESNSASYTGFELFIPYGELDLAPGFYELQSDVKLFYGPEFIVLDQRGFEQFTATIE